MLTISQTRAQIGINRTPGKLSIHTVDARLELHHKEARVDINTVQPQIQIDQHDAFSSAGLKDVFELTKEAADRGRQAVLNYIAKKAEDGQRLAAIQLGGNPIADIAKRDSSPKHIFGYSYIPKVGPKISVKEGTVDIEPEPNAEGAYNGVEGDYTPGGVQYNFSPSVMSVYMKQYPSISFEYQPGNNIDMYL